MEKEIKRIRIISILIITLFIIVIGFFGVYAKTNGIWSNVLPEYDLGMEFGGYKELHFKLDTTEETKDVYVDNDGNYKGDVANSENNTENDEQIAKEESVEGKYKIENRTILANDSDKINIENFEKTKKIIQKRLEKYDQYEYNIRQDLITGEIVLEVPDNEVGDLASTLITTIGKLEFIDSETGIILLDDSFVTSASPYVATEEDGSQSVFLQVDFNEQGKKMLEEITKEYVATVDGEGKDTTKYVEVRFDGQTIVSTYFQETITSGTVHIPMGESTTEYNEYYELVKSVQEIADIINEEKLPLVYVQSDEVFIQSVVTDNIKLIFTIVYFSLTLVISLYMIIKYKTEGLRQAILNVGYVALLTIVFRYVNVMITFNSLIALIAIIIINYVFAIKFLSKLRKIENRKSALKEALKELYLAIVPVCIIAIIFTFMSAVVINSVGMVLFWGLLLQVLCSLITLL